MYPQYRHLVTKRSTMLGHPDILKNTTDNTLASQMYPPIMEPRATEADYTSSVSDIGECRHTKGRCTPPLIKSSATEPITPQQFHMSNNTDIPNGKSSIFWYRLVWGMLLHTENIFIMQDPQRQPPRNTDHGWTWNWHKSPMYPYINMRTISQCRPIYSYPSTSNVRYYDTNILLSWYKQMYPPSTHLVANNSTLFLSSLAIAEVSHALE